MDLLTISLVALGLVVLFVVATHKSKKTEVVAEATEVPTLSEIAAKAEVVDTKPAKAKKAPAKKAAPAKKPAAKKPAAIKAPAKKAPTKKPAKAKKA